MEQWYLKDFGVEYILFTVLEVLKKKRIIGQFNQLSIQGILWKPESLHGKIWRPTSSFVKVLLLKICFDFKDYGTTK